MEKLNICIVSCFFYPTISPRSFRTTELAIEMAKRGHSVLVVLPEITKELEEFRSNYGIRFEAFGKLTWSGIKFGSGKIGNLLQRIQYRILNSAIDFPHSQLYFLVKRYLKNKSGFDLIISIARPHPIHWGVASSISKNKSLSKTWIADCGDPFTGATVDSFSKWMYLRNVENWAFDKCDYITIPIETSRAAYSEHLSDKIRIIPQGFRMDEVIEMEPRPVPDMISFAYAGSFIPGIRDPRPFLEYLLTLETDFRFYVFSNSKDLIAEHAQRSNGKIVLMTTRPRVELLKFLKGMDFLVNLDNNTEIHSPSKLIDYAITGIPILNITKNFNKSVVNEFMQGNYSNRLNNIDVNRYNIKVVADQFLQLC